MSNHQILNFSATAPAVPMPMTEHDPVHTAGLVGRTPALCELLARVGRVAPTDTPVLITGETGTGKELLARVIHRQSRRAARPMVSANLAAIPDTLAAAELFGHERGAFTGADRLRVGRFEAADRGTLFLDEVGELSAQLQVMLLRILQEGEFERLGGGTTRRVDVRLIAATNRDLDQATQEGRFREDLFYRLNVFPIHLPPLRERLDDIPALAEYFMQRAAARLGRCFTGLDQASLERLQTYSWPGNIRQLQNVIEHSAILCDEGQLQVPATAFAASRGSARVSDSLPPMFSETPTLKEMQKRYINYLLTSTGGNVSRAATILGVGRTSLHTMMSRFQIASPARHDRKARTSIPAGNPLEA